jgi:hypothetical protein
MLLDIPVNCNDAERQRRNKREMQHGIHAARIIP